MRKRLVIVGLFVIVLAGVAFTLRRLPTRDDATPSVNQILCKDRGTC